MHGSRRLFLIDAGILVLLFLAIGITRPDALVVAAYVLLLPYLLLTRRTSAAAHLVLASLLALAWMLYAGDMYRYAHGSFTLLGIDGYALLSWSLGLFAVYMVYAHWEHLARTPWMRLLLFIAIYWPLLIIGETVAYHGLGIRNAANAAYPGLPLCDCLHAPTWMQAAYFLMGPAYFLLCLGLKNPHRGAPGRRPRALHR